jgi:UDP-N-acetylglucosamine 2-epimerase
MKLKPVVDSLEAAGAETVIVQTGRVMIAFEALLATLGADAVAVVGDVNYTLA